MNRFRRKSVAISPEGNYTASACAHHIECFPPATNGKGRSILP